MVLLDVKYFNFRLLYEPNHVHRYSPSVYAYKNELCKHAQTKNRLKCRKLRSLWSCVKKLCYEIERSSAPGETRPADEHSRFIVSVYIWHFARGLCVFASFFIRFGSELDFQFYLLWNVLCICVWVCVRACVCVRVRACVCVYMCECACVSVYMCEWVCVVWMCMRVFLSVSFCSRCLFITASIRRMTEGNIFQWRI